MMDHNVRHCRSQHLETTTPRHVESQQPIVGWLYNMYWQHPEPAKGPSIIFAKVSGLLLTNYACTMPRHYLSWPPEMVFAVAICHLNGALKACTLEQMH